MSSRPKSPSSLGLLLPVLTLAFALACAAPRPRSVEITPRPAATGPRALCIFAHPDDETSVAGAIYKISTHLDGVVDLVTITNGEGGFKYSTLAEDLYGLELTEEQVGRMHLPAIRERELVEGLGYLHVRRLYLLDQVDHRYTQDAGEVLGEEAGVWDLEQVRGDLDRLLAAGDYDLVFVMVPTQVTHGHHQAASLLAAEAVGRMPEEARPALLAARTREEGTERGHHGGREDAAGTRVVGGPWSFDRTQPFGFRDRLDYRIVVNWVIAAHKSQGTMQLYMGRGAHEDYWLLEAGGREGVEELFERLAEPQFEAREYGESAGVGASG